MADAGPAGAPAPAGSAATLRGRICLVTGATSGIGRVAALELARRGARVVCVSRDAARGRLVVDEVQGMSGNPNVSLLVADLALRDGVRGLAGRFAAEHGRLDVLLNNAGAIFGRRELTADGIERTIALNHLAYFELTVRLARLLRAAGSARVVSVASEAHRRTAGVDDLQGEHGWSAWGAYSRSKLANVMFTYELARRLAGTGVTATAVHPGVVRSGFGRQGGALTELLFRLGAPFLITAEQGAQALVRLCADADVEGVTGRYFKRLREARSSRASYDAAAQRRLWDESERLTGAAWDWQS